MIGWSPFPLCRVRLATINKVLRRLGLVLVLVKDEDDWHEWHEMRIEHASKFPLRDAS